ncbi:TPA: dynamin family protein [Escherichia coli]|nr:dynamin family protein [Escherichia coli]
MHEKNIALLCDEADRLLQLNINLLRQMVEEPDVLSDSKNENRLLFDKQKALKRIEELEGEQIKTARREMVLAVVGTMKAGKSTTINAIVGQEILPTRSQLINSIDILRARRATGLMTRDNYRTVNNNTLGKYPEAK